MREGNVFSLFTPRGVPEPGPAKGGTPTGGYPARGYPTLGIPPSDLAGRYPAREYPTSGTPIRPGWGVPWQGGTPVGRGGGGTPPSST